MVWKNDKISPRQLTMLLIVNIFGTGVVLLPRTVTSLAGADGWLLVVTATLLALACTYLIASVTNLYPNKDFYEYSSLIAGRPLGFLLTAGLIVRLLLHMGLMLRASLEIIRATMLPTTPMWLLAVVLLLIAGFGASKGYETRARLAEVLVVIILVPVLFVFAIAAFNVDYTNLLPMFRTSPANISRGGVLAMSAFVGIEFLLLAGKYVGGRGGSSLRSPRELFKAGAKAIAFLGLAMTAIVVITTARFGIHQMPFLSWPVIQMMDSTALPGSFVERQGALVMSFFILSVFAMTNACLFFSSLMCKSVIKHGRHSFYIWACMAVAVLIALWPQDINHAGHLLERVYVSLGLGYMFVVPSVLLIVAKLRSRDRLPSSGHMLANKKSPQKALTVLLLLSSLALLTGCDKKELEERGYVTALAIDRGETGLLDVTMVKATGDDQAPLSTMSITANNLQEAVYNLDKRGNETLYFGITHTVVMGENLLAHAPTTQAVIDNLARDLDLPKDVFVLATADDTAQFIENLPQGKTSATSPKFDRSGYSTLNQLEQTTLETVLESLYRTGGVSLPRATLIDDYLEIIGLTLLENMQHAGRADSQQVHRPDVQQVRTFDAQYLPGYLLLLGQGAGETLVDTSVGDAHQSADIVATLRQVERTVAFDSYRGQPRATITLATQATIDQYQLHGLSEAQVKQAANSYAKQIETMATTAYTHLVDTHDSYLGLWELMRKKAPDLYQRYHGNAELAVEVLASVDILHTGALL